MKSHEMREQNGPIAKFIVWVFKLVLYSIVYFFAVGFSFALLGDAIGTFVAIVLAVVILFKAINSIG